MLLTATLALALAPNDTKQHSNPLKRVTVGQLDTFLDTRSMTSKDADVAHQLYNHELTERLSAPRLSRLEKQLPGPKSRQALMAVADQSAFLDLPPAEIPAKAPPDIRTQQEMIALTIDYVSKTMHQLPNFFATRITTSFQDMPWQNDIFSREPSWLDETGIQATDDRRARLLHQVGRYKATVRYLGGQEEATTGAFGSEPGPYGLTTEGEFGSILRMVALDGAQGKFAWSRWEQGASGLEAVYRFVIPAEASHYQLRCFCIDRHTHSFDSYRQLSAYHGEIAIDPSKGTVLRLTVQADTTPTDVYVEAAIVVEYGQIEIGGKNYICPARSAAVSLGWLVCPEKEQKRHDLKPFRRSEYGPLQTMVNDVVFTQYHLFSARSRILSGTEPAAH